MEKIPSQVIDILVLIGALIIAYSASLPFTAGQNAVVYAQATHYGVVGIGVVALAGVLELLGRR